MTRVFFVDYENKCQNFVKKSISRVDTFYQRAETGRGSDRPLLHVHVFYRADGPPAGLPGNRKWMTHHPIDSDEKNAADYALIEAVQNYPAAEDDEIYIVCGGDKIYRRTFGTSHCVIDDGTYRHLADYLPVPVALRMFLLFLRWLFLLRFLFFI